MDKDFITVEAIYDAPLNTVWRALTELDSMRQWFFKEIQDFRPVPGFETHFDVHHEGEVYPHQWKLTEVTPPQRIVYDWRYGGYSGESTVTWELLELPAGTQLKLTHRGIDTFPQDNPIFSRESGLAGWTYFVQDSLKTFLIENPK